MSTAPVRYEHPELGFTLHVPLLFASATEVPPPAAAVFVEQVEPSAETFLANLVVTVARLAPGGRLAGFVDEGLADARARLHGHLLLDRVADTVGGREAERTLAHHELAEWPLTVLEWRVLAAPLAYTLTATAATLDFPHVVDVLTATAESFAP